MEQIKLYDLMKRLMKVIQPTYFFPLLFISISSSLMFLIFHSTRSHFTLLPLFSTLEFNIDRNHMFLLCNGILVILVKSSSTSSPSSTPQDSKTLKGNDQSVPLDHGQSEFNMNDDKEVVVLEDQNASFLTVESSVSEPNIVVLEENEVAVTSYKEENKEEEAEEYEDELFGAEELNKRCEEFIRRMKLGIISETRRLS